jgi:hypothetical protein
VPPVEKLYTNKFINPSINLTAAEWTAVEARVKKELPSMRG